MDKKIILSVIAIVAVVTTIGIIQYQYNEEHFTLPSTRPPEWFLPQPYDVSMWLTKYYPDQLSENVCTPYKRKPEGILNFNSSAYRFIRF